MSHSLGSSCFLRPGWGWGWGWGALRPLHGSQAGRACLQLGGPGLDPHYKHLLLEALLITGLWEGEGGMEE